MGRPSKLTDAQWETLKRRLIAGEKAADLAREYGVSKAAISVRVSKRVETVKNVANQLVEAEEAVKALPFSEQVAVYQLAEDLRAISMHLAGAAKYGAATAHRLLGIANAKVQEIDDAQPLNAQSVESLKGIAVLTRVANDSATIPTALLNGNKETVKQLNEQGRPPPARVTVTVEDASIPDAEA